MGERAVELVLFDCDGVLVDSEPLAAQAWTEELAASGHFYPAAELYRLDGLRDADAVRELERLLGRALPGGFLERVERRTERAFRERLRPVPGIREALAELKTPCCVASSGSLRKIRTSLALTGMLERFEGRLFSGTEVPRGKPYPDLFLHAAATLGAAPRRCVVVEDSVPGVLAAVAAGMRVLGYHGGNDPARLLAAGAEPLADLRRLPGLV